MYITLVKQKNSKQGWRVNLSGPYKKHEDAMSNVKALAKKLGEGYTFHIAYVDEHTANENQIDGN